jgi:hypothetical protein
LLRHGDQQQFEKTIAAVDDGAIPREGEKDQFEFVKAI